MDGYTENQMNHSLAKMTHTTKNSGCLTFMSEREEITFSKSKYENIV
jgi:hypothetical protein